MDIRKFKVLAIDDNPDNLISLNALIKEAFPVSTVFTATTGKRGLELSIQEDPDVILLDIVMPEMDGFEVCRKLKANESLCDIPVVFVTALKGDQESRIKALECGGEAFLAKPIDESELTAQIRAMVKIKTANTYKRNENKRLKKLVEERTSELEAELTERKLTQKALQESEEKYRILFKDSPDSYLILSDGIFVDCNKATEAMLRGDRTQIIGISPDAISPDIQPDGRKSADSAAEKIAWALENGKNTFEWMHRRFDGSDLYVEVSIAPMVLKRKPTLFTTWRDISERKRAEQASRLSEERLRLISDSSTDIICSYDLQSRFTSANRTLCEAMQLSERDIIGKTHEELHFSEAQCREWAELHQRVLDSGHTIFAESMTPMPDGADHSYEIALNPLHDSDKGIVGIGVVIRDITERKKAAVLLEESYEFNNSLLKTIPFGMDIVDEDGNILFQSDNFRNIFGDKAIGCKCWDLYRDDKKQCSDCPLHKGIEIGETGSYESAGVLGGRVFEISHTGMMFKGKKAMLEIFMDITERKRAEAALKESEDRYKSFISQVTEGVFRFECDEPMDINLPLEEQVDFIYDHFFIAECNDAFRKIYGIDDSNEMIGKRHSDFLGGPNHQVNREVLRTFVKNGYFNENTVTEEIGSDNQKLFILNNSLGIIKNNRLVSIWGTQTDITVKMKADQVQQALYAISRAALSTIDLDELIELIRSEIGRLLDATNFYIAFYDEATQMLSTNQGSDEMDQIYSWPAEGSLTGLVLRYKKSFLLKKDEMQALIESKEVKKIGTLSQVWLGVPLLVNTKAIGAIVVQSFSNSDAYNEQDKLMLEFISNQVSISIERKKAEQELKLLGKAFDQSPVTIAITDRNGNIEYVNPKFSETTGYSFDEVKGNNPRIIQSGNQSQEFYQELWETILAGNDWFGEFQNRRKNGEFYWESAVISPITDENGQIAFFLSIKEEITEKKKMIDDLIHARNKAEESDRLKSAFLANMSHEIRTPLNSIIGFSELMADPDFDAGQQTQFAKIIINSGNSLLSIISDIMDFSKIEAGQVVVKKTPFVLQTLIFSLQNEYSFTAREKGLELRIDPLNQKEDIWISSDENRLRQVLVNLIGNAIKFTKEGYVEVGIKAAGDCIQFRVSDTGIGIAEEYHHEIFERFRQVESSNSRKYGGNGLGLAISKSLVEMMGGKIWMESVKGKGSTFYFTIPIGSDDLK